MSGTGPDPGGRRRAANRARFAQLVRHEPVDLAESCLLVGAEVDPGIEVAAHLAQLEEWAALVRTELGADAAGASTRGGPASAGAAGTAADDAEAARAALQSVLGGRAGLSGSADDYADLRSSLLHEVLRRRRGLPILLSVVWAEVGRRAGLPVYGVALPGHFVVGVGDPDGEFVLADPFRGGVALPVTAARRIAAEAGAPADSSTGRELLRPAEGAGVLLRVLNNIRVWAQRPGNGPLHAWTWLWAVELSLLLPRHPAALRRERGQLLARTGDFAGAVEELSRYAELVAPVDAALAEAVRREAAAARCRLN